MRIRLVTTALVTLAILAAGCGDDGNSGPSPFGPGDVGTNNDVSDAANDILEDLADGSLDEGSLDDLMESAQDMAESFGDSGAGTVTINGDTIDFTSEICFSGQGDFTIEGPGFAGDGTPVWVSISQTVDTREELAEFFDEDMLQQLYGDADPIIDSEMAVDYGRTELFGSAADDMPAFSATSSAFSDDEFEMNVDGRSVSGRGTALDYNFVAGDLDDRFDFSFSAGCG